MSLRTFHGHKDAIEELFPVKIKCDVADGYRYYVVKTSPKEQDSMLEWILNSFNIADIVGDARSMHDRILLEEIPGGTEYLEDIISSLKDNKELHLIYQSYKHPEPYDCHFQPYAMKVVHQRWYVLGYLIESKGVRTIALDRIQTLETTKKKFTIPKDFSAKDYFMNSVGIWVNEEDKPQKVVIRSSPVMADYLRSLPLHWSQKEIETTDKYVDFEYHVCINHELVLNLLGKGNSIEVLEPKTLISQLQKELKSLLFKYKNNSKV